MMIKAGPHVLSLEAIKAMRLLGEDVALVVDHIDPDAPGGLGKVLRLRGEEAASFRRAFLLGGIHRHKPEVRISDPSRDFAYEELPVGSILKEQLWPWE